MDTLGSGWRKKSFIYRIDGFGGYVGSSSKRRLPIYGHDKKRESKIRVDMMTNEEILIQLQKAREPKPKKERRPIAKVSKKKAAQQELQKVVAELDKAFYLEIWHASAHKCQNCGCGLGNTANNIFFHHLWEKRNYPQWRHRPENIALLCLECHSKCETNIDFAPLIKQRRIDSEKELLK